MCIAILISIARVDAAQLPITLMIVVDRSGSVQRAGTAENIRHAVAEFVESTSAGKPIFEEQRDVIGLGSFATSWKKDFLPSSIFRSGNATLASAIHAIPFGTGSTNTSEALYQAYDQLRILNRRESLNVILMITDGRPSAFTAKFDRPSECELIPPKTGVIAATVGQMWPPLPPSISGENGTYVIGLFNPAWAGDDLTMTKGADCHFSTDSKQAVPGASFYKDFSFLPDTDAYGNPLYGPIYRPEDRRTDNPRSIRFASFNAADNMATTIRKDRLLRPIVLVVGLNQPLAGGEPLDPAWLARVANDITYLDALNKSLFHSDQTLGKFFQARPETLGAVLQNVASYIGQITTQPIVKTVPRKSN